MEPSTFVIEPANTALLVVDVQERLLAAMGEKTQQQLARNLDILIRGARALGIKPLVTEQYPKGLGPTAAAVKDALGDAPSAEKICFAASDSDEAMQQLRATGARSVILCGMEAHVCVLQTAAGLLRAGFAVWVAEDGICSRTEANQRSAVRLLTELGAIVAPTESILFLGLGKAGGEVFKEISRLVK